MKELDFKEVEKIVCLAIQKLYDKDHYLIEMQNRKGHTSERSIVFRFAVYLEEYLNSITRCYNVDCEYNKNLCNPKKTPDFKNGIFPDVIIHERGNNNHNLLAIEVKTYWNHNTKRDRKKLQNLTQPGIYNYENGLSFVIQQPSKSISLNWYSKGKESHLTKLEWKDNKKYTMVFSESVF